MRGAPAIAPAGTGVTGGGTTGAIAGSAASNVANNASRSTSPNATSAATQPATSLSAPPPKPKPETATLNPLPPLPNTVEVRPRKIVRNPHLGPVSLGILIEASSAVKGKRAELQSGLEDIVGELGKGDEAFILSFGGDMVIEQDLTNNPGLLAQALEQIQPRSGAVLYDAVSAAAGHLKRISKNPNRILVIVSDGHDTGRGASPYRMESSLDEVRVFCLGVGVNSESGRHILQALASHTGGQASFVPDMKAFEPASEELARVIYSGADINPATPKLDATRVPK